MAQGCGVPATRATTAEEFIEQFQAALAAKGPHVIECIVPSII
jgi:acetolactate synthase-1/2/3 large subunit